MAPGTQPDVLRYFVNDCREFRRWHMASVVFLYVANYQSMADLIKFLMGDYCAGDQTIKATVEKPDGCCTSRHETDAGSLR